MRDLSSIYFWIAVAFTIGFGVLLYQQAGPLPFIIISGSMAVGITAWRFTNLKWPTDPKRLLPVYLTTAVLLMLHIWEEYVFDFAPRISEFSGTPWSEGEFLFTLLFGFPAVWIASAVAIYFRHPLGGFMAWFIFVGMIFGEPTHLLVFPIRAGGPYDYFPGMWTALFPLVTGLWGIQVMLADWKQQRRNARQSS